MRREDMLKQLSRDGIYGRLLYLRNLSRFISMEICNGYRDLCFAVAMEESMTGESSIRNPGLEKPTFYQLDVQKLARYQLEYRKDVERHNKPPELTIPDARQPQN